MATVYLPKFDALLRGLTDYLIDVTQDVQPVLLTGHSLGGAMAQMVRERLSGLGADMRVVTFGSPGALKVVKPGERSVIPLDNTGDPLAALSASDLIL